MVLQLDVCAHVLAVAGQVGDAGGVRPQQNWLFGILDPRVAITCCCCSLSSSCSHADLARWGRVGGAFEAGEKGHGERGAGERGGGGFNSSDHCQGNRVKDERRIICWSN